MFPAHAGMNRSPHMADWIIKLNDFLKLSDRKIQSHAGKISHEEAIRKAHEEYEQYRQERLQEPSRAEEDFLEAVRTVELKVTSQRQEG